MLPVPSFPNPSFVFTIPGEIQVIISWIITTLLFDFTKRVYLIGFISFVFSVSFLFFWLKARHKALG